MTEILGDHGTLLGDMHVHASLFEGDANRPSRVQKREGETNRLHDNSTTTIRPDWLADSKWKNIPIGSTFRIGPTLPPSMRGERRQR